MTDVTYNVLTGADDGRGKQGSTTYWSNSSGTLNFGNSGAPISGNHNFARFTNVTLPQGAIITSAVLRVTCNYSSSDTTVSLNVHLEDVDDSVQPASASDLLNASLTTGVDWSSLAAWTVSNTYDSPDLTTDLKSIVDKVGWASGNAITVHIRDNASTSGSYRRAASYDDATYTEPQLVVSYEEGTLAEAEDSFGISDEADAYNVSEDLPDTFGFSDQAEAYSLTAGGVDSFSFSDEAEAGYQFLRDGVDSFSFSDEAEAFAEAQKDASDTFSFSDTAEALNYSAWLRQNEAKAKQRFFFTLTGAADLTTDVEIPVSTIYVTKRVVDPTDVQVSIPSFNYSLDVALRPNGRMIIELGYDIDGEINSDLREIIAEANLDTISTYEGGDSRSIVLTGRKVNTYGANIITLDEEDLVYRAVGERARNYRFAKIHPFLNPGDTVIIRDFTEEDAQEAFTCNTVIYTINDFSSIMELSEAL